MSINTVDEMVRCMSPLLTDNFRQLVVQLLCAIKQGTPAPLPFAETTIKTSGITPFTETAEVIAAPGVGSAILLKYITYSLSPGAGASNVIGLSIGGVVPCYVNDMAPGAIFAHNVEGGLLLPENTSLELINTAETDVYFTFEYQIVAA